jgi:hypothetical protein
MCTAPAREPALGCSRATCKSRPQASSRGGLPSDAVSRRKAVIRTALVLAAVGRVLIEIADNNRCSRAYGSAPRQA